MSEKWEKKPWDSCCKRGCERFGANQRSGFRYCHEHYAELVHEEWEAERKKARERAIREGRIEGIKEALDALNPIPPRGDADRWGAGFRSAYETIAALLARAEEVERG